MLEAEIQRLLFFIVSIEYFIFISIFILMFQIVRSYIPFATVLVAYMPHQNKNAIVFSSLHNDDAIAPSSGHEMKTRHHNIL